MLKLIKLYNLDMFIKIQFMHVDYTSVISLKRERLDIYPRENENLFSHKLAHKCS